jgi:flagellar assembly protein FliH
MRARVIRREAGAGERWCAPVLGVQAVRASGIETFVSGDTERGSMAEAQRLAREEGFAQGLAQGLAAAHEQSAAQLQCIAALTANLREPLAGVDEQVVDELARLALAVARQVIRRELSTDPQQVAAVVEEARRALGEVHGRLCIALHPDEAAVVRALFGAEQALGGIRIDEDPSITRGGCTLRSDVSFVDATVETRIARIAVQLLGDERAHGSAEHADVPA